MENYQKITDQVIQNIYDAKSGWADLIYFNREPVDIHGKPFEGINIVLLNQSKHDSRIWATTEEFLQQGKKIRKGEKPSYASYPDKSNGGFRLQEVFNLHQCDFRKENEHLTFLRWEINRQPIPFMPNQVVTDYLTREKVKLEIVRRSITPIYDDQKDKISIANFLLYQEEDEYLLCLFIKLIQSTGHPDRLNRQSFGDTSFEPEDCSLERLIAEIGAYLLAASTAVRPDMLNSLAGVKEWIPFLMEDSSRIIKAFFEAESAVQFMLERSKS